MGGGSEGKHEEHYHHGGKNNTTREDPVKNTCALWTQINASKAYPHVFFLASNSTGTGKINDNARKALGKKFIQRPAQVGSLLTLQQQNTHTTLFEHIRKHLNYKIRTTSIHALTTTYIQTMQTMAPGLWDILQLIYQN